MSQRYGWVRERVYEIAESYISESKGLMLDERKVVQEGTLFVTASIPAFQNEHVPERGPYYLDIPCAAIVGTEAAELGISAEVFMQAVLDGRDPVVVAQGSHHDIDDGLLDSLLGG